MTGAMTLYINTVAFDLEPAHWDCLDRSSNVGPGVEPIRFELTNGVCVIQGKLLRLDERPRVVCEIEEEWMIQ